MDGQMEAGGQWWLKRDRKSGQIILWLDPLHIHRVDSGGRRSIMTPAYNLPDRSGRAFEFRFHLTIPAVTDISGQIQGLGFLPGRVAKKNALNSP
jgi:hypothetical protein